MDYGIEYKSNSKKVLIIILILLIIAIGGCYIYKIGIDNNQLKKEDKIPNNEEEQTLKEEEQVNIKEEDTEYTIDIKTLKSNGNNVKEDITLNGKTYSLVLENNSELQKDSIFTFDSTELCFIQGWGTGPGYECAPEEVDYAVLKGKDSKEYLFIYYQSTFDKHILILNDNTDIIGNISSRVEFEHYDCFATLSKSDDPIYTIRNNEIYYYKSEEPIEETTKPVELELIKIEISDNDVTEEKIGETKTGQYVQCT